MMTKEISVDVAFKNCTHGLNRHYPSSLKEITDGISKGLRSGEVSDFYGTGELIENFEKEMAEVLGKEAAVFLPSGTMAQNIAMRIFSEEKKNCRIGFHPTSHLELHEHHAYQFLHGLQGVFIGSAGSLLNIEDLISLENPLSALVLELPQREIGGLLPTWAELESISEWAKKSNTRMHLDGARLWECKPYYQRDYSEICALFDSVYVSFYKSLGGIAGAVLAGTESFIREAKVWQRRQGGNLVSVFPYVVSARSAYAERIGKMEAYVEKAKEVASALSAFPVLRVFPQVPQTNLFHVHFTGKPEMFEKAAYEIAVTERVALFRKLQKGKTPDSGLLEITIGDAALDLSADRIRELFEILLRKAHEPQGQNVFSRIVDEQKPVRKLPILETDRLILRPIELSDADSIFAYAKNPNVSRYTLWEPHRSVQDSIAYITDYVFGYYSKGVPEPFGIALKENPGKVIGTVGCFWTSQQAKAMELAYAMDEEHWGKGLVAEASRAVMEYCFKEFGLKRIQARCKVENHASRRVMEKVGMTFEGTLKSVIFHREKYWDMHYFAKVVE